MRTVKVFVSIAVRTFNEGDCGCSQENIDPRWAALVDIMEKDK